MIGSVLVGADKVVSEMVRERIPHCREDGFGACTAFGIVRDGKIAGGVVFNNFRRFDIHMSAALNCVLKPSEVRLLCNYAFGQLNVRRVTSITGKKNRKARRALQSIGFTLEGVAPRALDGEHAAYIYGLLREQCKWINNGNVVSPSGP